MTSNIEMSKFLVINYIQKIGFNIGVIRKISKNIVCIHLVLCYCIHAPSFL